MLLDILSAVFVLGVMVIFHELGHFVAAKHFKVRVEAFSVGFGKRIAGRVYGDTDYRLCALPLGGYVKMAGDSLGEGSGDPGEFLSKPRWQRFFIAVAGPFFNVILAVALLTGLYLFRFEKMAFQEKPADIGEVLENSPAAKAGLKPGDRVTMLDGMKDPNWEMVALRVVTNAGVALPVTYVRDGQSATTTVTPEPEGRDHAGFAGWAPMMPAIVDKVDEGEPAALAGIRPGDQIVALDGVPMRYWPQMLDFVQKRQGGPMKLTLRRDGRDFEATVTSRLRETEIGKRWRTGVTFRDERIVKPLPLGEAFKESVNRNRTFATMIFDLLGKLLERKVSTRSLSGPLGMTKQTGDAIRQGLPSLIELMSFISINLAIFNLLPIPILDGGMILLLLIEGTLRRDLSLAMKEKIITAGFVFLVLFAAYITYMDIIKRLPVRFERYLP